MLHNFHTEKLFPFSIKIADERFPTINNLYLKWTIPRIWRMWYSVSQGGNKNRYILLLILKMAYSLFKARFIVSSLCCLGWNIYESSEDENNKLKHLFLERKRANLEIRSWSSFFYLRSLQSVNQSKREHSVGSKYYAKSLSWDGQSEEWFSSFNSCVEV